MQVDFFPQRLQWARLGFSDDLGVKIGHHDDDDCGLGMVVKGFLQPLIGTDYEPVRLSDSEFTWSQIRKLVCERFFIRMKSTILSGLPGGYRWLQKNCHKNNKDILLGRS